MAEFCSDLNINKNKLKDAVIEPRSTAPSNPKQGQIYYDTTDNNIYRYDGTNWLTYQDELETENGTAVNIDSIPTEDSSNLVTSGGVWAAIQAGGGGGTDLPSQTGHAGDFLTTDGNDTLSWADIPVTSVNNKTGAVTLDNTDVGAAASSHTHGNITNGGDITATAPTIASGDQIIINDHSASKITNGPTFDGSTTTKYLSQKGTWESVPTIDYPVTSVNGETGAVVLDASDVGALPDSTTIPQGTVTSVRVQASSPLQSSTSTEQSTSLNTTISFSSQNKNLVLAGPSSGSTAAAPTFRSLVADDIPTITKSKISDFPTIDSTPTDGNTNNLVSSDGIYDKILDRTKIYTASCSTAASTAAKVATLDDSSGFSLTTGVMVAVRFQYGNSATTPTLRVDSSTTGTAKTIAFSTAYNSRSTGNGGTYNTWGPYETVIFTYDGTYWVNTGSALGIYNAYNKANSIVVPSAADAAPLMDGTATVGTSTDYAREDHVHPSDTSKAAASHTHGDITNTGDITATAPTIASGDKIIINDESASKITNGPSFGTSTTTYLRNDGSWNTPADNRDPGYGKIKPGTASSSTSAITANTTAAEASTYNETLTINPGNKWVSVAGSNSSTAGSDTFTIGHSAGLTAKTSYGSTSTTASANGGSITVTDIKYDEAGHITASTDRTITLSQSTTPASHASTATTYGVGDSSNYGHVKLSDSTSSTSSTSGGIAATPAAVKAAYDLANGKQASIGTTSGILKGNGSGAISAAVAGTDYQAPLPSQSGNSGKYLTTNGSALSWDSVDALPSQTGNSGKFLTTNGTNASWETVGTLPSQTGNSGKYLTTDGSSASWGSSITTGSVSIDSSPTASSTNLVESGGVYAAINTKANRTTAVNVADTNYDTVMSRGIYAGTTDLTAGTSALTSGVIYVYYE